MAGTVGSIQAYLARRPRIPVWRAPGTLLAVDVDRGTELRILVATAPFKEALGARAAAQAIGRGVAAARPAAEVRLVPVADGGEGTLDALVGVAGGRELTVRVSDPLGRPLDAALGDLGGGTMVVELARASGLELLRPDERDPEATSTAGTGEHMRAALDRGATRIVLGVGGSATCDGGMGAARALGVRLLDARGRELEGRGRDLGLVRRVDLDGRHGRLAEATIEIACDVQSPLVGPTGAARVFSSQKGADRDCVERLEAGMRSFAGVLARDCGVAVADLPMAGAAGGAAGGLAAMLGARLVPGAQLVLDAIGFRDRLADVDLCITGEGSLDGQTLVGKAATAVASACSEAGVPCVCLCGRLALEPEEVRAAGFVAAFAINRELRPLAEALACTDAELSAASSSVVALWERGVASARPATLGS